ncbi:MAG: hypothetical protein WAM30_20715 [Candidatus Dormiibacterota bacterium]
MARICANCRFENPDENEYCQSCGTSLAGVPVSPAGATAQPAAPTSPAGIGVPPPASPAYAPPPPAGYPLPPPPSSYPPPLQPARAPAPDYRSPYYAASGRAPQVGRMSPGLIVGVALAALVVVVVVALAGVVAVRALTGQPSGPTPSPTVAPTTSPSGGSSSTVDTSTFSLAAGSTWSLKNRQDNLVDLQAGSGWGLVEVMSQQLGQPETTAQAFSNVESSLQKKYPSVTSCIDQSTMTIGGISGTVKGYLYDEPNASGSTVQVCDAIWIDSKSNGDIYYYEQVSSNNDFNPRLEPAAKPVRSSIQWKLH